MFFGLGPRSTFHTCLPKDVELIAGAPAVVRRASGLRYGVLVIVACLLASGSACDPASSVLGTDPPLSGAKHAGREETLLGAIDERIVIARADYPTAGTSDQELPDPADRPVELTVVSIDTMTGIVTSLNLLFPQPMIDVPVSDGRWLAALDDAGKVWVADLAGGTVQQIDPLSMVGSLWALRYPWLLASDATGSFLYNLATQERNALPASVDPEKVLLDPPSVAYLLPQSDPGFEIHLKDLATGQEFIVDSVSDAQLYFNSGQFLYVTFNSDEQAYDVRRYDASMGGSTIAARLRSVPNPGQTLSILDVGSRGYLLSNRYRNDTNILIEQLEVLRIGGDRDLLTVYGAEDQTGVTALREPRFAGDHLVYRDPVDGFWIVADLETSSTRRINPFRDITGVN